MKGLSFITQFKIEILLLFADFRKVLGKMLETMWQLLLQKVNVSERWGLLIMVN